MDASKNKLSSPSWLECRLYDICKLISNAEKVGFTQIDRVYCPTGKSSPAYQNTEKQGASSQSEYAAACERGFYDLNTQLLKTCGACIEEEPNEQGLNGLSVNAGPRVILDPHIGVTIQQLQKNIRGSIHIVGNSTVVLKGRIQIENLRVEGILLLEGNGKFENIQIKDNLIHKFFPIDVSDQKYPSFLKIRGYDVKRGKKSAGLTNCREEGHEN